MRRIRRRQFLAISGAAGAAALLAACGGDNQGDEQAAGETAGAGTVAAGSTAAAPKYGGMLRLAEAGELTGGLNPHTGIGGNEHAYFFPLYDPLIGYNQKGELDPAISLAEKWELTEPTRIVFKLRQGVTFHDGTAFNADVAKWNLDFVITPANLATPRADLASIESVEVTGPSEIVLKLKQPSAPLLTNLGDRGGQMNSRAAFEKIGKDAYKRAPVGSGPFMVKEYVVDAYKTYERNPTYWRKDAAGNSLPYLQGIRWEIIPDDTVRVAALESGQIDLLPTPPATDVQRLTGDSRFQNIKFVGSSTGIWTINHGNAPMDNVWMRRGFAAALDKPTYVKNFLTGEEPLAGGLLTPVSWAYDPSIQGYPYDPAKAKEYLQRSGLPPEKWRVVSIPGARFTEAHQFWEANLKASGIMIDWQQPDPSYLSSRVLKGLGADGSTTVHFIGWSMRVDPDGTVGAWFLEKGGYNPGQVPCPETEHLIVKAREIYDQAERKKLYSEIQRRANDELYSLTTLWYTTARAFANKKVGNLEAYFGGEGKPRYANLWLG
jgi:peptide/nickel transport system permease protein/peptide/nickel transport system substrate-binding protein